MNDGNCWEEFSFQLTAVGNLQIKSIWQLLIHLFKLLNIILKLLPTFSTVKFAWKEIGNSCSTADYHAQVRGRWIRFVRVAIEGGESLITNRKTVIITSKGVGLGPASVKPLACKRCQKCHLPPDPPLFNRHLTNCQSCKHVDNWWAPRRTVLHLEQHLRQPQSWEAHSTVATRHSPLPTPLIPFIGI